MSGADLSSRLGIRRRENVAPKEVDSSKHSSHEETSTRQTKSEWKVPAFLQWIPTNAKYHKIKPVVRCTIAGWIALVLFVIPRVQQFLGQASFLILIASFLSPPSEPFLAVLEREVLIMFFASLSWSWCCLGITLADLARTYHNPSLSLLNVVHGDYIEAGPTVILGVFIFIGSSFFLFIKAHQGPGPYVFPYISLTTSVLFPFPYYKVGKAVVLPLVFHSAIALVTSILVFPSTISAHFTTCLEGVLSPLVAALELHQSTLTFPPHAPEFAETAALIGKTVGQSEAGLTALAAATRLMPSDLIYGRYAPGDFLAFQDLARRIAGRGNGMGVYFTIIDPTRQRFPVTPAPSVPGTPILSRSPTRQSPRPSRVPSRAMSPERDATDSPGSILRGRRGAASPARSLRSHSHNRQASHLNLHRHIHHNLLHHAFHYRGTTRSENVVGVFESQRYLNLEATRCKESLLTVQGWLGGLRRGRFAYLLKSKATQAKWAKQLAEHEKIRDELDVALRKFRQKERHRVLDMYRPAFDPKDELLAEHELPAHRYLFQAYVYQYHLIQFAGIVIEMVRPRRSD
ncbi:hypothetical protein H0H81_010202 [Sphagnurus paluster]|uniref:Putative ER transporter 6TM N-terminal domain-containing protein n=1 Tax=Sphagnurus paluster TaxID=117069 RepID=A0A9P7FX41_9AGAR|nr:hypothetical protein H0H81_010202 [Sphagnurus paluster]